MHSPQNFAIVQATPGDIDTILYFIRELAKFEKLEHEVLATPELLSSALFSNPPAAEVVFLEISSENLPATHSVPRKVGFALFFTSFSTFLGRPGLYLEDLFVLPEFRGRGYGAEMLRFLARETVQRGFGRLEWSVLDWNESAIKLYRRMGAQPMTEWTVQRLAGEALKRVATGDGVCS